MSCPAEGQNGLQINQSVEKIAVQGSMKCELHEIALKICKVCIQNNFHLEMEWVPRSENARADKLSKFIDRDNWSVSDECFQFFDNIWGPHTVDQFASYYNRSNDLMPDIGIQVVRI